MQHEYDAVELCTQRTPLKVQFVHDSALLGFRGTLKASGACRSIWLLHVTNRYVPVSLLGVCVCTSSLVGGTSFTHCNTQLDYMRDGTSKTTHSRQVEA